MTASSRTLAQIETALDAGLIETQMANGNWWRVRRNGQTKTWKTRPTEFSIPVKIGFNRYGAITHQSLNSPELRLLGQD